MVQYRVTELANFISPIDTAAYAVLISDFSPLAH